MTFEEDFELLKVDLDLLECSTVEDFSLMYGRFKEKFMSLYDKIQGVEDE